MNAVEITKTFLNMMPIMEAYLQGKTIEYKDFDDWKETTSPAWNLHTKYRVKPEPKYIPFNYNTNLLGRTVIYKDKERANCRFMITTQGERYLTVNGGLVDYEALLIHYAFEDGSPCGKLQ